MIHVDRDLVSEPPFLKSPAAKEAFVRARLFYERPESVRRQERHQFDPKIYKHPEVRAALRTLFNGKCAYCESQLEPTAFDEIDQFRPKAGSYDINTQLSLDHYWWLAYDWRNLYLVCQVCNANKGSQFPVENRRVKVPRGVHAQHNAPSFWKDLEIERPLLLDPCSKRIVPGDHLLFDETGRVAPLTAAGEITINTLKLNRSHLVHERRIVFDEIRTHLEWAKGSHLSMTESALLHRIKQVLAPSERYLAVRRTCVKSWLTVNLSNFSPRFADEILNLTNAEAGEAGRLSSRAAATIASKSLIKQKRKERAKVVPRKLEAQFITKIELHNFRAIEHLEIELASVQENYTPWLVLLGDNGMGKSSILKAVALTLMEKEHYPSLKLDASKFVRHGQRSGYVKVYTSAHTKPFELTFRNDRKTFTKENDNRLQTLLLGYGGTRLLPRGRHKPPAFTGYARIDSLFDPFLPLLSADSWLRSLDRKTFAYAARCLKDLMIRDNDATLFRRGDTVKVRNESAPQGVRLEDLSDGYQSMVALSTDIMRLLMKGWQLAEKAHAIVLLDEIDVHLHPRWKMHVTESLRQAFPRVQFIVTTHDPLCLKDTKKGEVRVLNRDHHNAQIRLTHVDVPPGATADQLLTGFWFGLSSTIDAETLAFIDEHRLLLTGRQTPARVQRCLYLEEELRRRLGVYADTSMDRMAQSVASEMMRARRPLTPKRRQKLREQLLRKLSENQ